MATAEFFNSVRRPLFNGRLSAAQVDGLNRIVQYGVDNGYSRSDLAYVLATVHWETGRRMQPVREGFASTDAGARRAVTRLYQQGKISRNYSLPTGPHKQSYYGRSLVQITWLTNYKKFSKVLGVDLVKNPDLALEWEYALPILFIGMRDGLFRKASLDDIPDVMNSPEFEAEHRNIINGDVRKNGGKIAQIAAHYWHALEYEYDRDGQPKYARKEDGWARSIAHRLGLLGHSDRVRPVGKGHSGAGDR